MGGSPQHPSTVQPMASPSAGGLWDQGAHLELLPGSLQVALGHQQLSGLSAGGSPQLTPSGACVVAQAGASLPGSGWQVSVTELW